MANSNLLEGKKALVCGVANDHSIGWKIAEQLHGHGASVSLSYADERLERKVRPLGERIGAELVEKCDVSSDPEVDALFESVGRQVGHVDVLVHAIAYAGREELAGAFSDTSRDGFRTAMEISVYSLIALARRARGHMPEGGSILTLTYYGGEKVAAGYNVMGVAKAALESATRYLAAELGPAGIRVNALSPGPIRTLSAAGVPGFKEAHSRFPEHAPLRRHVEGTDVGNAAVWLASDLASGVTGETVFVDAGSHILAPGPQPGGPGGSGAQGPGAGGPGE